MRSARHHRKKPAHERPRYVPDAWQYPDQAIAKAAQRGIYVILDLHGAVGSQGNEAHSGCAGRNWYWNGGNGQPASYYQHSDIAYGMAYQPTIISNIEAEHFTSHRGTRIEVTSDPLGGDFSSSYLDSTDFMTYRLEFRVASPTGGTVILGRDGVDLATTTVPNTGGYQNWQTISTTVALQAGTQSLTVFVQTGGWNLNWWSLTPL